MIESGQEVVREMPRCEIRHKGRQVLRQPIRESRWDLPVLSKPSGQIEGGAERVQEKDRGIVLRSDDVCLRAGFPQQIRKISR